MDSSDQDHGNICSDNDDASEVSWIQWFCSIEGHEFFAEIDQEFLEDSFNLFGIKSKIPNFNQAYNMILSSENPDEEDLQNEAFLEVYQNATDLFGILHARYILTPRGLAVMREKYLSGVFGVCPRVMCDRHKVLPIAVSDELKTSRVKVYCPKCKEVYVPKYKSSDVDGAYFGVSFPHILLQTYPDLVVYGEYRKYAPKVYGFRLFKESGSKFEGIEVDELW